MLYAHEKKTIMIKKKTNKQALEVWYFLSYTCILIVFKI